METFLDHRSVKSEGKSRFNHEGHRENLLSQTLNGEVLHYLFLHLFHSPRQCFRHPRTTLPFFSSPVSSYAKLIHMSHHPERSPRQHLDCVCVCVYTCVYCTFPTSQPTLHPAVRGVVAEIDKLMLKALCLRSLLE